MSFLIIGSSITVNMASAATGSFRIRVISRSFASAAVALGLAVEVGPVVGHDLLGDDLALLLDPEQVGLRLVRLEGRGRAVGLGDETSDLLLEPRPSLLSHPVLHVHVVLDVTAGDRVRHLGRQFRVGILETHGHQPRVLDGVHEEQGSGTHHTGPAPPGSPGSAP